MTPFCAIIPYGDDMKKMPNEAVLVLIISSLSLLRGIIVKDGNITSPPAIIIEILSQICWVSLFLMDGWDKTRLKDVEDVDILALYNIADCLFLWRFFLRSNQVYAGISG